MLNLNLKGYLQGLPVFLAVEASGSLTRAARVLGVSKAAVSQSLSTLEETLGARLFQRNTRGLSLTEAGRLLAEEARGPVLALKEAAHRIHANAAGVTGELRITASPVAFEPLLLPAIKRLLASHSELRVTVDLNDHFVDIVRSGFDAGIRLGESVEKDMIGRRLRESSPCAVVASPEYLSKRGMPKSPEDVLSHDCIGFRFKDSIVPWEFGQEPNVRTLSITPKLALNSLIACVTASRDGLGLAYALPRSIAEKDLASGALVEVLNGQPTALPTTQLYYSSRRQVSPKIKALLEALLPNASKSVRSEDGHRTSRSDS